MLSPGSKGWINKYFELVDKGSISLNIERPEGLSKLHFMHLTLGESGITFGYPIDLIFAKNLNDIDWTADEKLKLLLFEAHLFVFMQTHIGQPFEKEKFISDLDAFYQYHNAGSLRKLIKFLSKFTPEGRIEAALIDRVEIERNFLENKWWVTTLSNAFIYLDVILFDDFAHWHREEAIKNYGLYALNALTAITLSAYSDGVIERREKRLFDLYLASANLDDKHREIARRQFKGGASFNDFSDFIPEHWLLKRFLFDLSALNIFSHVEVIDIEGQFLEQLAAHLEITQEELDESLGMIENFVLKAQDKAEFLKDSTSYDKVYKSLSKRWTKILMRNKDKLAYEVHESKELIRLVNKSRREELTPIEKELVKRQLKDIARSIPALTIFMIPGGTILLPIMLKIIPDLVPTAFRDNELDDKSE